MSTDFVFGTVNDTDESLKGKSGGGKFGLNHGNITKIEFTATAGKDSGPGNAVDIWVQIGEREYRRRLYETTTGLYGKKNVLIEPGQEGYAELYVEDMKQKMAVIVHAVKAIGVTQAQIDTIFTTPATSFTDWATKITSLVPAEFQKKPVDIFLEYQWEIGEDQDKTYPELPKNMKGGRFLDSSVAPVGKWNEVRDEKGLHYKDDAGNIHPFDRSLAFMESNKGIQQGNVATTNAAFSNPTTANQAW
jgi:hypothetical protein